MEIRTHTFNNEKLLDFPVRELSKVITSLYKNDQSLFKQFEAKLLDGEFVTPMIYFVKRTLIRFDIDELYDVLEDLKSELHRPLYLSFLSFLDKDDTHAFSMYLVKNRRINYIK